MFPLLLFYFSDTKNTFHVFIAIVLIAVEHYINLLPHSLYICCCCLVAKSCLTLCKPMDSSPPGSSAHWISQAKILEWVAISFSRGIFPTHGSNPHLLHCRQILYQLSHQGSPICLPLSKLVFSFLIPSSLSISYIGIYSFTLVKYQKKDFYFKISWHSVNTIIYTLAFARYSLGVVLSHFSHV